VNLVRVALDVPLDEAFDFVAPEASLPPLGSLVIVPFGRTRKVGVVVGHPETSPVAPERLKPIEARVDDVPPLGAAELELFGFCAAYYQRPLGEVAAASLPPRLRQVSRRRLQAPPAAPAGQGGFATAVPLSQEQLAAREAVLAGRDAFHPVLLQGVTGSGKTEVYLHLIADAIGRSCSARGSRC
jgi:primosomal protein N' (replication factor Y)